MKRKDYTVETADLPLADLLTNEGQLEGVPANPRQITGPELDKLVASLRETPELLEGRGILCVPYGEQFVILGGHRRAAALRTMGETTAPCVIYRGLTAEKMREIVIKDNGSFGEWDFDALANAWDDLPLKDWGVEMPADWDQGSQPAERPTGEISLGATDIEYGVKVVCKSLEDQLALINKLHSDGYECSAI